MDIDAIVERILGEKTRLERRRCKVCFHVLSVNLVIKYIDAEKSFWQPISSARLDYYFGLFAWNDWFFSEFLTRSELNPAKCAYSQAERTLALQPVGTRM